MKEQLVSFETAVLAKEKGFNVETLHFYCKNRTCDYIKTPYKYSFEVNANQERLINGEIDNFGYGITWSAPTQSLLQRWLDITYNKYVHVEKHTKNGLKCYSPFIDNIPVKEAFFNDYDKSEEALEKGLQEALKLIK